MNSLAKAALYLNNTGVTLLSRGYSTQAAATFKDAISVLKEVARLQEKEVEDNPDEAPTSSRAFAGHQDFICSQAAKRLAQTKPRNRNDGLYQVWNVEPSLADWTRTPCQPSNKVLLMLDEAFLDSSSEFATVLTAICLYNYAMTCYSMSWSLTNSSSLSSALQLKLMSIATIENQLEQEGMSSSSGKQHYRHKEHLVSDSILFHVLSWILYETVSLWDALNRPGRGRVPLVQQFDFLQQQLASQVVPGLQDSYLAKAA